MAAPRIQPNTPWHHIIDLVHMQGPRVRLYLAGELDTSAKTQLAELLPNLEGQIVEIDAAEVTGLDLDAFDPILHLAAHRYRTGQPLIRLITASLALRDLLNVTGEHHIITM